MTSEIIIMNKQGIALASDSAVTIGGTKTKQSANKIFALSKYHPVGIMIFGNAMFMEVPWDIIIKQYRRKFGKASFKKIKDYVKDFLDYLKSAQDLFPQSQQKLYFETAVKSYFTMILKEMESQWSATLETCDITNQEVLQIAFDTIADFHEKWMNSNLVEGISIRRFP